MASSHVHFHSIVPDGVFAPAGDGTLRFVALPPPEDEEVFAIALRIAGRVLPLLDEDADDPTEKSPSASPPAAHASPMPSPSRSA